MRLHRHRWREQKRKAVPGVIATGGKFKFDGGILGSEARDVLYGYTLIEQRCEKCGYTVIRKFTGEMASTLARPP